jgi:hypothetical protein
MKLVITMRTWVSRRVIHSAEILGYANRVMSNQQIVWKKVPVEKHISIKFQIKVKNNGEKIKETNNEKPVFPFTKSKTPKQKTSIIIAPSFFKRIEL